MDLLGQEMPQSKSIISYNVLNLLTYKKEKVRTLSTIALLVYFFYYETCSLQRYSRASLVTLGFPGGSDGKESVCNVGDLCSIPGLGRSPGGGHGNPLQYSCLENPHGQRSLTSYSPWGHKESDTTERLSTAAQKGGGGAITNNVAGSILILCDSQCTSTCTFVVNTQEWNFWL